MADNDYGGSNSTILLTLFRALWRRKFWIIIPALIILALTFFVLTSIDPYYTSEARILIEDRRSIFTRSQDDPEQNVLLDEEAVQSHVQLLKSRDLVRRTVEDIGVKRFSGFDKPGAFDGLLRFLGVIGERSRTTGDALEDTIDNVLDELTVIQLETSRVISIEFTAKDPDLAADFANQLVDNYILLQREAKKKATSDASAWLGDEITKLRGRVEEAEAKVATYRKEQNILQSPDGESTFSNNELADLASELARVRSERSDAEARANIIKSNLRNGGDLESASAVLDSPLIQRLQEQRVTLRREIAEQSAALLPAHPRMVALNGELQNLDRQIKSEAQKVVGRLESDARVAKGRENALKATIEDMKAEVTRENEQSIELRALEREADAQKQVLEAFLKRFGEATARDNPEAQPPEARIVSRAVAIKTPSFPKKVPILAVVGLGSLLLFAGLFAALELMQLASAQVVYTPTPPPVATMQPAGHSQTYASHNVVNSSEHHVHPNDSDAEYVLTEEVSSTDERNDRSFRSTNNFSSGQHSTTKNPSINLSAARSSGRHESGMVYPGTTAYATSTMAGPSFDASLATSSKRERPSVGLSALLELTDLIRSNRGIGESQRLLVSAPQRQSFQNWTAINLSRALAKVDNEHVVLIDANLYAPSLATNFMISVGPGLYDLLIGTGSFFDVVQKDPRTTVDVITTGTAQPIFTPMISMMRLEQILDALEGSYRHIIINAPPILYSNEAAAIAHHCDMAVLTPESEHGSDPLTERSKAILTNSSLRSSDIFVAKPVVAGPVSETGEFDMRAA